ncbi:MAG: FAD-dependent oxidoreductase [Actinomycetota bacterium]
MVVGKPVILAVDDDQLVLNAVQRDLRQRYAEDYTVVGVTSGKEALTVLNELAAQGDPAALLIVDQRMPEMTGVDFLEAARRLDESTQRVLLTAYADTEAAIAAINRAGVAQYILKPWDPPESKLYPILDDLLDTWRGGYRPRFSGIRVLGDRWDVPTRHLKDFLARNQVPYQSVEAGGTEGQVLLSALEVSAADLPVVLLEDGRRLVNPSIADLAEAARLHTRAQAEVYDLIIVGAGPAGLAAAVYAASEGLSVLAVEREAPGGQAGQSARIENYLGFPAGLSGADLTRRAVAQASRFSAELLVPVEAVELSRNDPYRIVRFSDGAVASGKTVLIATGVSYRMLAVPGVDRYTGSGVYYGASAVEATEYRGRPIVVIGAGNAAGQAALFLAGTASEVRMVVRGASLAASMSAYLIDRIDATPNIEVTYESKVTSIEGGDRPETITVRRPQGEEQWEAAAVFIFVGQAPRTDWLAQTLQRDTQGFILTGSECAFQPGLTPDRLPLMMEASVPGVFAAGDVRAGSIKRVASATGEGSMAVKLVHQHLESL